MKALKEKRISLRSLWRMGLVVLSVLALSFAACANSDGDEGSGPTGVNPQAAVPVSATVASKPLTSGTVHEGQIVDLTGIVLSVRYSDNQLKPISDPTKMTVYPPIFDATYPSYIVYYSENGRTVNTTFAVDHIRKIIDLDVTGQMTKQEYVIDDIPQFGGLTANAVYSSNPSDYANRKFPNDIDKLGAQWNQQPQFYRMPITLTTNYPEFIKWAWLDNATTTPGSFIDDKPGVLVSIGSYGAISSKIRGEGIPANPVLEGKRIEITKLYQVASVKFNGTVAGVFYDDPTLIGAVANNSADIAAMQDRWLTDVFPGASLDITYTNKENRNYPLTELLTMNSAFSVDELANVGKGGTWANLELYPVSRALVRIDVTKDTKDVISSTWDGTTGIRVLDFGYNDSNNETYAFDGGAFYKENAAATTGTIVGDGGWAQWAQLGLGYTKMRVYWRGKFDDAVVPIYNRPTSMSVSTKDSETYPPLVMNGYDYVYRRPEGLADFLNKLNISVTYTRQGGSATDTKIRTDLVGDIANGTCRGSLAYPVVAGGGEATPTGVTPTLYSTNIFNYYHTSPGGDYEKAKEWMAFSNGQQAVTDAAIKEAFALTKTNVDNYITRQRTVAARIEYIGNAGNYDNVRIVNNRTIVVAPTGTGYQD